MTLNRSRATTIRMAVLTAAVFLCLSAPAQAVTYFVRQSGSDSNSGLLPSTAWKTIDKAANTMVAGDTVYVGAGTYNESVTPNNDGSALWPIRYIADTTGAMTGDVGPVTLSYSGDYALLIENDDYQEFTGFRIIGPSKGVSWKNSTGGRLEQCEINNTTESGALIDVAGLTLSQCIISNCSKWGVDARGNSTVSIAECEIRNNAEDGVMMDVTSLNVTIARSRIHSNAKHGLWFRKPTASVVNCLIYRNGWDGIQVEDGASKVSVWHSTLAYNGDNGIDLDAGTITVTNSIVAFNGDDGLDRDGGTFTHSYNLVHGNLSADFEGTGPGTGEITSDPQFLDQINDDYRLTGASPAIDAGTDGSVATNVDIEGSARPSGAGWDMGCYEGAAFVLFFDVSDTSGFAVQTTSGEGFGSGLHWGDFDLDGDLDAIVTGNSATRLMNNIDIGSPDFFVYSFGGGNVWRQGALSDLDNDGDVDFWSACVGSDDVERWFEYTGSVFSPAGDAGFFQPSNNESCAAVDIDADGWCDIVMFSENGNWIGINQQTSPVALFGTDAWVYGLSDPGNSDYFGNGDYCSTGDVNNDGRLDFFYHYLGGKLFLSEGDGTYKLEATSGILVVTSNTEKFGSAWGDYDNDGDLDLFVPRYAGGNPGYLWRNNGDGTFTDVAVASGIDNTAGQRSGCWGDYDNDGFLDLYVVTRSGGNALYHNDYPMTGAFTFSEVFEGTDATGNNHDAVFVDYDNDGDLDLSVSRQNPDTAVLLRNNLFETFGNTNYLKVWVRGAGPGGTNRAAIGVTVELFDAAGTLLGRRDVGVARGYGGTEPLWLHFGVPDPAQTYQLKVNFVTGPQVISVVPANVSTTIKSQTIQQMVMVEEPPVAKQVIQWEEDDPLAP